MKRVNVSLLMSQFEAIKQEAMKECCSMADIIRRILDAWLRDKK
jgi:hypothetical protein